VLFALPPTGTVPAAPHDSFVTTEQPSPGISQVPMPLAPELNRVAYLVNVYPAPSHTFIRREILAHEAQGWEVTRFSIRRTNSPLHDVSDQRESEQTEVVLEVGGLRLAFSLIVCGLFSPIRWLRAASMAWRLGRISDVGRVRHGIYLAEACLLRRRLRGLNIHHLHAHFGTNPATVALLCFLVGGPKYSFTVHGPEEFDKSTVLGLDEKIHHAAFVVAISQFGRSQLYRWSKFADWPKVHVVHCGLDREFFDNAATPIPDNQRLVCVGRLCEQKGQLLLVDAFAKILPAFPDATLVLVGDGPMRAQIEDRIRDLAIERSVRITGWASGETVKREITDARAFVLPSFAEGLPVVIMEAFSLGRPVISTYIAGIPELVKPGENGWLVPAGDVDALAAAIKDTLETPTERLAEMGRAGREAVLARHDIRTEAGKLAKLFEDANVV